MLTDDGKHLYVSWDEYHMLIERLALKIHASRWQFDQILCLGYVVATPQARQARGPPVCTYYLPFTDEAPAAARAKLLAASWDDLASAVLADLSTAHRDLPDLVARLDVVRWGHAMARPTPGFLSSPVRHLAPVSGVHFAHADSAGLPLFEEAQDAGVRAAEAIRNSRGEGSAD